MSRQPSWRTYALLLVLAVAVLWIAVDAGGPETDVVRQYTAYEVDHDDGELVLTDVATGERRDGVHVTSTTVDDRIACLPSRTRECHFERQAHEGEIDVEAVSSRHRYLYLDGEFYRIQHESTGGFDWSHERTSAADALAELAIDSRRLTDDERAAVESGRIVTARPLANANRILEYEGRYYTIGATGHKAYSDRGGSFCASSGDDFCNAADQYRWTSWGYAVGLGLLGLLGTVVGGRGLLERWRRRDG